MQSSLMLKKEVYISPEFFKIYYYFSFLKSEKYIWVIFVYSEHFTRMLNKYFLILTLIIYLLLGFPSISQKLFLFQKYCVDEYCCIYMLLVPSKSPISWLIFPQIFP